jgi:hypothetical protein
MHPWQGSASATPRCWLLRFWDYPLTVQERKLPLSVGLLNVSFYMHLGLKLVISHWLKHTCMKDSYTYEA